MRHQPSYLLVLLCLHLTFLFPFPFPALPFPFSFSFLKFISFFKFFYCYFPNTVFFPLYSMGTQLHTHVYTLFSPIVILQCKYLDIVLNATQQDLIVNPSQKQQFASINPKLPIHPTPSLSPRGATSLFSKSMIFFSVERFICAVY